MAIPLPLLAAPLPSAKPTAGAWQRHLSQSRAGTARGGHSLQSACGSAVSALTGIAFDKAAGARLSAAFAERPSAEIAGSDAGAGGGAGGAGAAICAAAGGGADAAAGVAAAGTLHGDAAAGSAARAATGVGSATGVVTTADASKAAW
eukprot:CAMPEP_0117653182 /NCGR_PEP_ID=MMETSP0804-20121206/3050_1 /TAXON_ID=1074897 /ORGANISM="Tetraselmis astigmatica, Strain CCMP880" /LENGTH=147 /DNA_ID=CAMNT_0005459331 /DNA_START=228 /DNA_END=670 /DNA_ORIENTATION=+